MKGCNCGTVHKESHAPDCAGFAVEHAILSHEISLLEEELANLETERDAARQHGIDTTNAAHAEAQRFQALAIEREAQVVKLRAALEEVQEQCTQLAVDVFDPHPRMGNDKFYRESVDASVTRFTNWAHDFLKKTLTSKELHCGLRT